MNLLSRLKLNWYDDREIKRAVNLGEYRFKKNPMYILDLGAHKGFATEWFVKEYPNATIHSYEPNPVLFALLKKRTAKYPNVKVFNEAIADHDGLVSFSVSSRNVSSHIGEGQQLPCISLQTALKRIGGLASIKCDVEGAEFDIFKETNHILEIVGEVHPQKTTKNVEDLAADLAAFFTDIPNRKGIFRAT